MVWQQILKIAVIFTLQVGVKSKQFLPIPPVRPGYTTLEDKSKFNTSILGTIYSTPYTDIRWCVCTPYTVYKMVYVHRTPYTVHLTPYTVHRTPYTVHRTPYTVHLTPYTVQKMVCVQELDPIALQDEAYMFEEFVRAPLPFKVNIKNIQRLVNATVSAEIRLPWLCG